MLAITVKRNASLGFLPSEFMSGQSKANLAKDVSFKSKQLSELVLCLVSQAQRLKKESRKIVSDMNGSGWDGGGGVGMLTCQETMV